jgi:hypothetical protein
MAGTIPLLTGKLKGAISLLIAICAVTVYEVAGLAEMQIVSTYKKV